mgnify:FL=1
MPQASIDTAISTDQQKFLTKETALPDFAKQYARREDPEQLFDDPVTGEERWSQGSTFFPAQDEIPKEVIERIMEGRFKEQEVVDLKEKRATEKEKRAEEQLGLSRKRYELAQERERRNALATHRRLAQADQRIELAIYKQNWAEKKHRQGLKRIVLTVAQKQEEEDILSSQLHIVKMIGGIDPITGKEIVGLIDHELVKANLGKFAGFWDDVKGGLSGDALRAHPMVEFNTRLFNFRDRSARTRTGAAMPDTEVEYYKNLFGHTRLDAEALRIRLQTVYKGLQDDYRALMEQASRNALRKGAGI